MTLTYKDLQQICNAPASAAQFIDPLNTHLPAFGVDTPIRICGFLGQVSEESASFSHVLEMSSGTQYEGRKDLGNVKPGDGARFKGRGLIQLTGRALYHDASMGMYKDLRLLDHPELLEQPDGAVLSACWYWFSRGLNAVMDVPLDHQWRVTVNKKPAVFSTYQWLTEKINGGQNGYLTRLKYFRNAQSVIGQPPAVPAFVETPTASGEVDEEI